jgi:xanthine dehydrogenase YagR molybdenum-binding subunit
VSVVHERVIGAGIARLEGPDKVTGQARYAYEYRLDRMAYGWVVQSPVARGRIEGVDTTEAMATGGVIAVLWYANSPRLPGAQGELAVLQSDRIAYRGQVVAMVVAESPEVAREAAGQVRVQIATEEHKVELDPSDPELYAPDKVNPNFPTDTCAGDPDAGLAGAAVSVDVTYRTPAYHNNPMEPHATTAVWVDDELTVFDSNQGASPVQATLADLFELDPEQVRVVSPHVGGGFGSKGTPRPVVVLAALAARTVGCPVKLAMTRQQMFSLTGYRTPTIQRVRLGAGPAGRLSAVIHEVVEQTSRVAEFAEQTAVATRMMYAAPHRRTSHRLVRLDVPTPSWMRAPGEAPGMYALESAMDELAVAAGIDPVELRIINEPDVDPDTGQRFSSRNLVACLRQGAERFGWAHRNPAPRATRRGEWMIGTGVAASTYPARTRPCAAAVTALPAGTFLVEVAAADIGTGARTVLAQIAADALGVPFARIRVNIGDSSLPSAPLAGGSMGTSSWGSAVAGASRELRRQIEAAGGAIPAEGLRVVVDTGEEVAAQPPLARHAFGAQFVEAHVNTCTGEVRIPRMAGVFAAGRIVNPLTARSQLVGGMTMGMSMALMEESILDPRLGDWVNKDLADYHVATYSDVAEIDVTWIDENDPDVNGIGVKGIGEIGIVGTAAAVTSAVFHATGVRIRDLPVRPDKLLAAL